MTGAMITPSVGGTPGTPATFAPAGVAFTTYTLPASVYNVYAMAPGAVGNSEGPIWVASDYNSGTLGSISSTGASYVFTTGYGLPNDYFDALAPASNGGEWFAGTEDEIGDLITGGIVNLGGDLHNWSGELDDALAREVTPGSAITPVSSEK